MKKNKIFIVILLLTLTVQISAQVAILDANQQPLKHNNIKDELLHLYNTEPQLCHPSFSSKAHTILELQKIPSVDFWSWIKNYINSYVEPPYFRVMPEKAPQTIAFLKTMTEKMGIDQVPDLYLNQNSWNSYNLSAGSGFFENTKGWFDYLVNSAINYTIIAKAEDEWKLPLLTLRYLVPTIGTALLKKYVNPANRIFIHDKKTVAYFSENTLRATLAHEAGHIKHNDHTMKNIIHDLSFCVIFAATYYSLKKSKALRIASLLTRLFSNKCPLLNQLMSRFNIGVVLNSDQFYFYENLMIALTAQFLTQNIHALLNAKISRFFEYRADLEAARVVGFEQAIANHREWRSLEPNAEQDFALIPSSDYGAINCFVWVLKKLDWFKEWKDLNSPFRSHPTAQQRIDYLRQKQAEADQRIFAKKG